MKKLAGVLFAVLAVVAAVFGTTTDVVLAADTVCEDPNISQELKIAAGCVKEIGLDKDATIMPAAVQIVEVVIAVIGILAAGMFVYGGINYVLSIGSPDKVRRAQNIVIYAGVGLVVAVLSFGLVYFVSQSIWG